MCDKVLPGALGFDATGCSSEPRACPNVYQRISMAPNFNMTLCCTADWTKPSVIYSWSEDS